MKSTIPEIGVYDLDDELIELVLADRSPRFDVYIPERIMVVLGIGSDPETELYLDKCIADKVTVVRRKGGGCSVVLDPGIVIVSAVLPVDGIGGIKKYTSYLTDWLMDGLTACGIDRPVRQGICDIVSGARKIAGSSMRRRRGYFYYSSSILFDPDPDLMSRYLKHPPREPGYRKKRDHGSFMVSLKKISGINDIDNFRQQLMDKLEPLKNFDS